MIISLRAQKFFATPTSSTVHREEKKKGPENAKNSFKIQRLCGFREIPDSSHSLGN